MLITGQTRLKLYNAFITACFRYCSDMWHFCSAHIRHKLEQLNKQILKVVLKDSSSIYEDLLTKLNMTNLEAGRVQSMMVTLYKCLNGSGVYQIIIIEALTCCKYCVLGLIYGLRSFRYYNPYAWNDLSDDIRKSDTIASNFETKYHKRKIIDYIY